MFLFSVKKRVFELSRVWPWRWPCGGNPYMEFIGLVFHYTNKFCLKRVGHIGFEWVENKMCRFAVDMSLQTHCTLSITYMKIGKKNEFQWKWYYRIKHVKCYRMVPIYPVQLWILSALGYFKYNIHENWEKRKWISMKVGFSD